MVVALSSDTSSSADLLIQALEETTQKTESSLLENIQHHVTSNFANQGLDFLDTKNTLLLSYLIDLTVHLRGQLTGIPSDRNNLKRLKEMKVVLEKTRGLDKKLKYQIDKLLATASSTSFASTEDPLQFRPNAAGLDDDESSSSDDDNVNDNTDHQPEDPDNSADDDDADLAAARLTLILSKEKHQQSSTDQQHANDNVYQAPRLTAVPYTHDKVDQQLDREHRQRRRMRASEVAQTLRAQFDDTPEQDDLHGGAALGLQREAAQRVSQRAAEQEKHEEENFVRLVTKRSDRKESKRVLRQETSNLTAISDLGNIVRGAAYGGEDRRGNNDRDGKEDPWSDQRHANGKRKKVEMDSDGRAVQSKKKFQSRNSLQSELFTKKPSSGGKKYKHRKSY
jgi:U3 small nucleolar ribonucleoprotein protein LCP5